MEQCSLTPTQCANTCHPEHYFSDTSAHDHTGLRHLLDSNKWQQMVGWGPLASSDLLFMPGMVQHESEEHASSDMGLRRGLLASMMRLSVNQQVRQFFCETRSSRSMIGASHAKFCCSLLSCHRE